MVTGLWKGGKNLHTSGFGVFGAHFVKAWLYKALVDGHAWRTLLCFKRVEHMKQRLEHICTEWSYTNLGLSLDWLPCKTEPGWNMFPSFLWFNLVKIIWLRGHKIQMRLKNSSGSEIKMKSWERGFLTGGTRFKLWTAKFVLLSFCAS